ncbi:MAG TPA: M23 family metallopeptidase [Thermoleophilaceae bacterium]|nr:M23 family metallopeptidase [Thermoleophilaceae bacterium]
MLALAGTVAPATAQAATSGGGGVAYAPQPTVATVLCVQNCATKKRIQGGSTAKISGQNLGSVMKVVFKGSGSKGAAKAAAVKTQSATSVLVAVPIDAQTGPVQAIASGGVQSQATKPVKILPPPPPEAQATLTPAPGTSALETATSAAKWFLGSQRGILFSYRLTGASPADVDVNLVRQSDGAVIQTWTQPQVAPNEVRTVRWIGVTGGQVQPEGRYAFRAVIHSDGVTATSATTDETNRDAFDFYGHFFPVRGSHNYGGASARFGAARSGHSHQGQDVLAPCGTKLVAAQGGTVKYAAYQSAAGYYIVIHGVDGTDNAYMHLAQRSPFSAGDTVYTGQQIGIVGETGDATTCHLHFEIWTPPGWYEGGHPVDPLPSLQSWDGVS